MSTREGGTHVLQVELVTPDGPVYVDEARMVVVAGAEGELGVLPRHAPLVARLDAGETRIRKGEESWVSYATGPGYFKIQADRASVLVSSAVLADEVDLEQAERDRDAARARLEEAGDEETPERRRAQHDLEDAENRLRVGRR